MQRTPVRMVCRQGVRAFAVRAGGPSIVPRRNATPALAAADAARSREWAPYTVRRVDIAGPGVAGPPAEGDKNRHDEAKVPASMRIRDACQRARVHIARGIRVALAKGGNEEQGGYRRENLAMKRHFIVGGVLLGAMSSVVTWTGFSFADTTVVEQPAPAPASTVVATPVGESGRDDYTGPNRRLIGSGLVTFGLSYIPALVVAGTSDLSTDHHLYVPIVGPWLDVADRPSCGVGGIGCDTETTYKVLLVVDGVFQGLGAITTVAGFLSPEHHVVVSTADVDKLRVQVTPSKVASGYGLAAFGSF